MLEASLRALSLLLKSGTSTRKKNCYLRNQADSTVRSTGLPKFKTYFKDMRDKYKNYDFDYALKYSLDIADKYHFLKAEYIVRKSTEETAQAKLGKAPTKDTDEEKEIFGYYKH